ncbi:hypothetical protein BDV93DRAFT_574747 [Ceratobasidium sp. AG-I]|nr:hypothetical protein BDV93DRAFT_574747 [Ceratobasidium sp. AG-I]
MFSLAISLGAAVATAWLATPVAATSCTAFDSDFNLYGFGLKGRDFAFGPQSGWANARGCRVTDLLFSSPFDGTNTQCFTAEYFNAIYVLNADASQAGAVHIFDAAAKTWTTQQMTLPAGLDPANMVAILDHDTNVFFAFSKGNLFQADFSNLKAALPTPIAWEASNAPTFNGADYAPVMGLAQNHIHFLNTPATTTEGLANIFVIHFAYWQPEIQYYAAGNNAGTFPQKHGQVASFFAGDSSVQKRFAFLPDDMSSVYVIDVDKNTTTVLPAPPASPGFAANPAGLMGRLSASPGALVYLSPANELHYVGVDQNNMNTVYPWALISSSELVAAAAADPVSSAAVSASGSSTATASGGMVTSRSASGSATGTASAAGSSGTSSANGAMGLGMGMGASVVVIALAGLQAWLMF